MHNCFIDFPMIFVKSSSCSRLINKLCLLQRVHFQGYNEIRWNPHFANPLANAHYCLVQEGKGSNGFFQIPSNKVNISISGCIVKLKPAWSLDVLFYAVLIKRLYWTNNVLIFNLDNSELDAANLCAECQ